MDVLLGLIFGTAYVVALMRGRNAFLYVLAAAAPFNDSAAVSAGPVVVSPFYLGLMIYAVTALFSWNSRVTTKRKASLVLVGGLLVYGILITVVGPILFAGTGVIASGVGIDEQVGYLTPLQATTSNVAQAIYLALNAGFVYLNERDRRLTARHISTALTTGTVVAFAGYIAWRTGVTWPTEIFDNSSRNFYAESAARLRSQFAEPSHLGAFALVASAYFVVLALQARTLRPFIVRASLALMAALALVSSGSGTGVLGAVATVGVMGVLGVVRAFRATKVTLSPTTFLLSLGVFMAAILAARPMMRAVTDVIEGKQGGISLTSRTYSDNQAFDLFAHTWGLGVGLGSNRSSSLFFLLISTVGLVGTLLFLLVAFRAVRNGQRDPLRFAASIGLVAFLSAAFISYGDFASPLLWLLIAFCFPGAASLVNSSQVQRYQATTLAPRSIEAPSEGPAGSA